LSMSSAQPARRDTFPSSRGEGAGRFAPRLMGVAVEGYVRSAAPEHRVGGQSDLWHRLPGHLLTGRYRVVAVDSESFGQVGFSSAG
jgi:hypothetical protein